MMGRRMTKFKIEKKPKRVAWYMWINKDLLIKVKTLARKNKITTSEFIRQAIKYALYN